MAGKAGKTKFTIENATRTRLVIADQRIHILGSFQVSASGGLRTCLFDSTAAFNDFRPLCLQQSDDAGKMSLASWQDVEGDLL